MKTVAIDLGLKRIGLAYAVHKDIVTPLPAVIRKNRNQAALEVSNVLKEWDAERLVVGIALGGSSEEEMRRRITHFVNLLSFEGEVCFVDESGSSKEAEALIKGEMRQIRDGRVDSIAAMIILQRYLTANKSSL
jgi:putative Holliday junction resolvase